MINPIYHPYLPCIFRYREKIFIPEKGYIDGNEVSSGGRFCPICGRIGYIAFGTLSPKMEEIMIGLDYPVFHIEDRWMQKYVHTEELEYSKSKEVYDEEGV